MLFILSTLLLLTHRSLTTPAIPSSAILFPPSSDPDPSHPTTSIQSNDRRTAPNIIFSCLFTLALCIALCVRPDIPQPKGSRFPILRAKLNIAFWMLVCPEFVLYWAFNQWREGRKVAESYQERRWTTKHGLYLIMGGFMIFKDGAPHQILCDVRLANLSYAGAIEFPSLSAAQLVAEHKNNTILIGIFFLQVTWFFVHCVARLVDGLPITQLEAMTLAQAVMYTLLLVPWWNKPLDVRFGRCIDINPDMYDCLQAINMTAPQDGRMQIDVRREEQFSRALKHMLSADAGFLPSTAGHKASLAHHVVWAIPNALSFFIEKMFVDLGATGLRIQATSVPSYALAVPIFYAPNTNETQSPTSIFFFVLIGGVFQAAHFFMLRLPDSFPTHDERHAWKVLSLIPVSISAAVLGCFFPLLGGQLLAVRWPGRVTNLLIDVISGVMATIVVVAIPSLTVARIGLCVEALVCLRELPRRIFEDMGWAAYIPHFS